MNEWDVYKRYVAIKTHFSNPKYNLAIYKEQTKLTPETFKKRNDFYVFKKVAKAFYTERECVQAIVANAYVNDSFWIGDVLTEEGQHIYRDLVKRTSNLEQTFMNDMASWAIKNDLFETFKPRKMQYPLIFEEVPAKISYETLLILNEIFDLFEKWNACYNDELWKHRIHKHMKYRYFLRLGSLETYKKYINQYFNIG